MTKHRSLASIFERYQNDLLRFISSKFGISHDAEDIVQDTFHNILRSNNLEAIDNPRAYLYKSAHNLAIRRLMNNKRYQSIDEDIGVIDEEIMFEPGIIAERSLEKIEHALNLLPAKYHRTFTLSRVEGKSYSEISDELGIAVSTVEKHIIRVLKHLRDHVGDDI